MVSIRKINGAFSAKRFHEAENCRIIFCLPVRNVAGHDNNVRLLPVDSRNQPDVLPPERAPVQVGKLDDPEPVESSGNFIGAYLIPRRLQQIIFREHGGSRPDNFSQNAGFCFACFHIFKNTFQKGEAAKVQETSAI